MVFAPISPALPGAKASADYRWMQLILGVICMVAAANIQYAWTLFVPEIQKTFGWQRASIQTAFTLFILVQTWLTPLEGYLIDRYGPRIIVLIGATCVNNAIKWFPDRRGLAVGFLRPLRSVTDVTQ